MRGRDLRAASVSKRTHPRPSRGPSRSGRASFQSSHRLRGRAQADTMQAMTGGPLRLNTVSGVDTSAARALGAVGNILRANVVAGDVAATEGVGVLATARGQAADAGSGLAKAAKLARSEDLNRATARLSRATNIQGNIGRAGGQYMKMKGLGFMDG